jgi:hypothetical protein
MSARCTNGLVSSFILKPNTALMVFVYRRIVAFTFLATVVFSSCEKDVADPAPVSGQSFSPFTQVSNLKDSLSLVNYGYCYYDFSFFKLIAAGHDFNPMLTLTLYQQGRLATNYAYRIREISCMRGRDTLFSYNYKGIVVFYNIDPLGEGGGFCSGTFSTGTLDAASGTWSVNGIFQNIGFR